MHQSAQGSESMVSIMKIDILVVIAQKKEEKGMRRSSLKKNEDITKVSHQTSRGDFTVVTEMRGMIKEHSPRVHFWFEVEWTYSSICFRDPTPFTSEMLSI